MMMNDAFYIYAHVRTITDAFRFAHEMWCIIVHARGNKELSYSYATLSNTL